MTSASSTLMCAKWYFEFYSFILDFFWRMTLEPALLMSPCDGCLVWLGGPCAGFEVVVCWSTHLQLDWHWCRTWSWCLMWQEIFSPGGLMDVCWGGALVLLCWCLLVLFLEPCAGLGLSQFWGISLNLKLEPDFWGASLDLKLMPAVTWNQLMMSEG